MSKNEENASYVLVDIGGLNTKSLLIEKVMGEYSIVSSGEARTSVDPPVMDVSIGVKESIQAIEGQTIPSTEHCFLFSSDASGGLHMVITGLISRISSESAQRAALGAGALLIDQFSKDDGRPIYSKVASMRSMKPDILLMAGGTDGGAIDQVLEMARVVAISDVKPRFGSKYPLPVIFAGNEELQDQMRGLLNEGYATTMVDNVRPLISKENLGPARESIYDAYMEHVLVHSPGFSTISEWTNNRILPSQAAVGMMFYAYAQDRGINLIGVDVGGDTTDVYSVFDGVFNRSLNADIGLTYGLSNILKTSGVDNILRWLTNPDERAVRNMIGNMMINHVETLSHEQKEVQAALAREAIRQGMAKHQGIASRLKGTLIKRTLSDMFDQELDHTRVKPMKTDMVIGKGKMVTQQTVEDTSLILMDSLQVIGFTELAYDLNGYSAHFGNLINHNLEAALKLFTSDCLSLIGTCIAPVGGKQGSDALKITFENGVRDEYIFGQGAVNILPFRDQEVEATFTPINSDLGDGKGKSVTRKVRGGSLGLIIDTRNRPITGKCKSIGLISTPRRSN